MSRRSIIICLAVLAVMIVGVGVAVAVLYSGVDSAQTRKGSFVPDQERYLLLPAVPADAALVACLSDVEDAVNGPLRGFRFPDALAAELAAGSFPSFSSASMVVSLHYGGKMNPLYVFDAGQAASEPSEDASALMSFATAQGLCAQFVDCSKASDGTRSIAKHSVVLVSDTETLVKSATRHLAEPISVMYAGGFADASQLAGGKDLVFIANHSAKTLMPVALAKARSNISSPFIANLAQWTVIEIEKTDATGAYAAISSVYDQDASDYMTVLEKSQPAVSKLSQILPSFAVSAISLPMKSAEPYIDAYQSFMDSKQSLQSYRKKQRDLTARAGLSPEEFVKRLDIKEMAKASFLLGKSLAEVNLMRIGKEDTLIFVGTENKSFKHYVPATHAWPYASFAASVFGDIFQLKDESCFTYINGWIISGSMAAVEMYVKDKVLDYNLTEYMANAGQKDLLASEASLVAYFSLGEYPAGHKDIFTNPVAEALKPLYQGCDYCPAVLAVSKGKDGLTGRLRIPRLEMMKSKAPQVERDTTVVIPQGPFKVKNCATGRTNLLYQNEHGAICLKEEDGKGLWGVPFKEKMCGAVGEVDYYANGKIQFVFAAGSKVYIIDRLGNYVNGFPIDLGKEILLGPDVYDFNKKKAYNIMVLHKDFTVDMYNLKGKKPDSWKGIVAPERIKELPERLEVGGSTYWVVRTSIQTLIYPFYGGSPLTTFTGDKMVLPKSEVTVVDGTSVSVECYDGQKRTVVLK